MRFDRALHMTACFSQNTAQFLLQQNAATPGHTVAENQIHGCEQNVWKTEVCITDSDNQS